VLRARALVTVSPDRGHAGGSEPDRIVRTL
jgi:hypothetical protein